MPGKHSRKRPWWKRPFRLVVIVVLAIAVGVGVWSITRSGSSATPKATASTSTSNPHPASEGTDSTGSGPTTSIPPTTTATVSPPISAPGTVTYTVAAGTPVEVVASHPCWIEVRATATGPITHEATLEANQTLSLTSPVWIRIGNPANIRVTAGTTILQVPTSTGDLVIATG